MESKVGDQSITASPAMKDNIDPSAEKRFNRNSPNGSLHLPITEFVATEQDQ